MLALMMEMRIWTGFPELWQGRQQLSVQTVIVAFRQQCTDIPQSVRTLCVLYSLLSFVEVTNVAPFADSPKRWLQP